MYALQDISFESNAPYNPLWALRKLEDDELLAEVYYPQMGEGEGERRQKGTNKQYTKTLDLIILFIID